MSLSGHRIIGWTLALGISALGASCASIARFGATGTAVEPLELSAPDPLPRQVKERREHVLAAIEHAPANDWSAQYYEGDGLGENVIISLDENAGITATWYGCMGLYGANEGRIENEPSGRLSFHFQLPNGKPDEGPIGIFPETVIPVRWGKRRYLVPEDRGIDFVNAMHHGFEPRDGDWGTFLLARGDESKPVNGLPDLPSSLAALVREQPLVLRVTKVDAPQQSGRKEYPACVYRVHFELPAGETLFKGMELRETQENSYSTATVAEIEGAAAIAEIREYAACAEVKSPPQSGWSFSTGAYPPVPRR